MARPSRRGTRGPPLVPFGLQLGRCASRPGGIGSSVSTAIRIGPMGAASPAAGRPHRGCDSLAVRVRVPDDQDDQDDLDDDLPGYPERESYAATHHTITSFPAVASQSDFR